MLPSSSYALMNHGLLGGSGEVGWENERKKVGE